jgi:hypothetical protein
VRSPRDASMRRRRLQSLEFFACVGPSLFAFAAGWLLSFKMSVNRACSENEQCLPIMNNMQVGPPTPNPHDSGTGQGPKGSTIAISVIAHETKTRRHICDMCDEFLFGLSYQV